MASRLKVRAVGCVKHVPVYNDSSPKKVCNPRNFQNDVAWFKTDRLAEGQTNGPPDLGTSSQETFKCWSFSVPRDVSLAALSGKVEPIDAAVTSAGAFYCT